LKLVFEIGLSDEVKQWIRRELSRWKEEIVTEISDAIKAANDAADEAIARVDADLVDLRQQIVDLQAKIDAGTATAADIAGLSTLKDKLLALDPRRPETLPPTPTEPPAEPPPTEPNS
jgi:hypothetical protein